MHKPIDLISRHSNTASSCAGIQALSSELSSNSHRLDLLIRVNVNLRVAFETISRVLLCNSDCMRMHPHLAFSPPTKIDPRDDLHNRDARWHRERVALVSAATASTCPSSCSLDTSSRCRRYFCPRRRLQGKNYFVVTCQRRASRGGYSLASTCSTLCCFQ